MGALVASMVLVLASCGGRMTSVHRGEPVRRTARWVMLPVQNHSETPQAGERVEAILETLLRKEGLVSLDRYPPGAQDDSHLLASDRQRYETALEWARTNTNKYDYAITGSVEEWRYKSGLDGEPAIDLSMRVIELPTGRVVWGATGTQTGSSAENTSGTALKLLGALVEELGPTTGAR